jgi:hypothetical protein
MESIGQPIDHADLASPAGREHARSLDANRRQHEPEEDKTNGHQDPNAHQRAFGSAPNEHDTPPRQRGGTFGLRWHNDLIGLHLKTPPIFTRLAPDDKERLQGLSGD